LKLDGLPPEEVEELVVHEFGPNVASISDDLFKMIEILCLGNPFMIIELTAHLKVRCCCFADAVSAAVLHSVRV
jgi:hypothetical protein